MVTIPSRNVTDYDHLSLWSAVVQRMRQLQQCFAWHCSRHARQPMARAALPHGAIGTRRAAASRAHVLPDKGVEHGLVRAHAQMRVCPRHSVRRLSQQVRVAKHQHAWVGNRGAHIAQQERAHLRRIELGPRGRGSYGMRQDRGARADHR
eukprot:6962887-Prymnesium_polylepis.2